MSASADAHQTSDMFTPKSVVCLRGYSREQLGRDLLAAATTTAVALPLALAFAIGIGVRPSFGLISAIVGGFVLAALGGSRVQIAGPSGSFIGILGGIVATHGYDGLAGATLLAGVFLMVFGIARLGAMIKFIPYTVITGFTLGIAVTIFTGQIRDLLGLQIERMPLTFVGRWLAYFSQLDTLRWTEPATGGATIALILALRRWMPKVPGMLVALTLVTTIVWWLRIPAETVGSRFGDLPRSLPAPTFPQLSLEDLTQLVSPAFTLALLVAIESLMTAQVADGMIEGRTKSNLELVAEGAANIASVLFGGFTIAGVVSRTVTAIKAGARTPVCGMALALMLLVLLYSLGGLAKQLPLAALAGVLVVVSLSMFDLGAVRSMLRAPKSDMLVSVTTFFLTVFVDLSVAVQVGVVMASMLFVKRMGELTNIGLVTREFDDKAAPNPNDPNSIRIRSVPEGVLVYEVTGPFFFGAAERFREAMRQMQRNPRVLILRMRDVPVIDATGLNLLAEFHHRLRREGVTLILSDVHAQPLFAMEGSREKEDIGEANITGHIDDALARARELLGLPPADDRIPFVPSVERHKTRVTQFEVPKIDDR